MKLKRPLIAIILIQCLIIPVSAFAGAALETVKGHCNTVLEVLRDPSLKPESMRKVKKDRIRAISVKMFDFTELSKRTLATNWEQFNPDQQREFIELYRSLLEDAYAAKILAYADEKIVFIKEVQLSEKTVEVQSTLFRKTDVIPVYYRVILKDGMWRIYDVVIEGVSLINNYRSQFREILSHKTPGALLETLRKKVGKGAEYVADVIWKSRG